MSFREIILCWGPIRSPVNIHKFNLRIPISLGTQAQTYVKKIKFWKLRKRNTTGIKLSCIFFYKKSEIFALNPRMDYYYYF